MRLLRVRDVPELAAGTFASCRLDYTHGPLWQDGVPAIVADADPASATQQTASAFFGDVGVTTGNTGGGGASWVAGSSSSILPFWLFGTAAMETGVPGDYVQWVTTALAIDIAYVAVAPGAIGHVSVDGQAMLAFNGAESGSHRIYLDGLSHTIRLTNVGDATLSQALLGTVADTSGTGLAASLGLCRNGQPTQALVWTVAAIDGADVGVYNQTLQPVPASAPTGTPSGTGGSIPAGNHTYEVTYVNPTGETAAGTASGTVTTTGSTSSVALASIPTGPAGTTARKVYRSDGGAYGLVLTIANNTATTGTDTAATLGAAPPSPGTAKTPVGVLADGSNSDQLIPGFTLALNTGTWGSTNVATVQTFAPTLALTTVTTYSALLTTGTYTGAILDSGRPDTEWPLLEYAAGPLPVSGIAISRGAGQTPTPDASWAWQTPTVATWDDPGGGNFQRVACGTPGLVGRYSQTVARFSNPAFQWASDIMVWYWQPTTDPTRNRYARSVYFGPKRTVPFVTMLCSVAAIQKQDALDFASGWTAPTATGRYLTALGQQVGVTRRAGESTASYQQRVLLAQQGRDNGGSQPWLEQFLSAAFGCDVAVSPLPRTTTGGMVFPFTFPGTFGQQASGYWRWQAVIPFDQLAVPPETVAAIVAEFRPLCSLVSVLYE